MRIELTQQLKETGLTDKEALIYSALVELGGAFPSRIAEYTKLNRSTTYKILLDLSVKGLINEIKKRNKLYYQIEKPDKLERYAKDRIKIAEDQYEEVLRIVPKLNGLFSLIENKPKVRFFEGPDAVWSVCEDMISLPYKYEMKGFSNAEKFRLHITSTQLKNFVHAKERLGITTKAIVSDTKENRQYNLNAFASVKKNFWPKLKYIPKEQFPLEAELTLYGKNRVSITKFGSENLIGVIIEDDVIYGMINIFEALWNSNAVLD